ncbi:MAG: zinc ribbon domain-containing protein [Ardenticatenaceae bacterium]|nr:zinc ribbon domain-containing protein [Ardenticatenaceae bacterium]MCB9445523.1 zinc ribbon domain-containing protein [Ardenticatenaceae bacterium]
MSKEIICPNCQASNTPGSKFCNNCGNRLPPSTSLICPNCKTPNPRDRFYCDHCGSRLIKDSPASKGPEEEKPLPQTGTFFSLPARPPGQTGELDPLQIVPDWLKKQAEAPQEEDDEEDLRLHMPKIEEVGPSKKVTDDLPDWLVDEHDSDPIIGSPRIITTEHFMNLVQPPATAHEAEDLTETADKAELPDWLSDLASPTAGDKAVHSDDLSTPDDALNEWLASISGSQQDEPTSEADDLEAQLASLSESKGLSVDWEEKELSDEFSTDWLVQAAKEPLDTDSLAGLETEDQALGDEMFDWMTENLVDSGMLDASVVADSESDGDDIGSDWLTDFAGAADEESLPDAAVGSWLDAEEFDETDASALADLTDAIAQQDMAGGDLPGWISEIAGQDEDEAVPTSGSQPDWMAEFATADSEAFAQELESKLEALDADQDDELTAGLADELESLTGGDDEWLDDFATFDESEKRETAVPDETLETPEPIKEQPAEPEPLPDWLSDLGGGETLVSAPDDRGDIFTDLFAPAETGSSILDWIGDEAPEAEAEVSLPADDAETGRDTVLAETDWLSEMVTMGEEAFAVADEETAVSELPDSAVEESPPVEQDLFAADWPEEADEEEPDTAEPGVMPSDWGTADSLLAGALDEELPDWLDELGAPPSADEAAREPDLTVVPSESMPDWIAQMKPGSGFHSGGLTESSELPDLTESYPDLPTELVGPGLPDWLQDADEIAAQPVAPLEELADIPEWLAESIPSESGLSGAAGQAPEDDQEWTAVLQDLPTSIPVEERLVKADIPDWILALQPARLSEDDVGSAEAEVLPVKGGPLAGIRGVIEIEPVVAEAHPVGAVPSFTTSPEQISQVTLLRQLALADKSAAQSFSGTDTSSSGIVRLLLAGLLLVAILLGLMQPNLLPPASVAASAHLAAVYTAVEEAAGAPVLVAVDYTPALSGELDAQTEMLLAQLAANGSSVVTVSQSAAGTAVIQRLAADYPTLGLLPGQSVGLRQLGDCLAGDVACNTLSGKALTGTMQQSLNDVALIIVLTGERDNLVDWLEQVALSGNIPVVAGVTKSLAPVALPYLDTTQLQGMIGGLPETAVYQQELLNQPSDDTIMRQLSAQMLAQLLAAGLLLVGGITFGVMNLLKRGKR